jgi:AcrR family transcriptional regulator
MLCVKNAAKGEMSDENSEPDLPRGVALAWSPQREPKRELSVDRIVDAAVDIADADGLAAVSMGRVAASLGFATMSLYRHLSAKEDLILLMQEQGVGLPPKDITSAPNWREGLRRWAAANGALYRAHPWLAEIPISGIPTTPHLLAWMDAALAVLHDTPLPDAERIGALLLVMSHTHWEAVVKHGYAMSARSGQGVAIDSSALLGLITSEALPHVSRLARSGAFGGIDDPFTFGLERILDGIEQHMVHESGDSDDASVTRSETAG